MGACFVGVHLRGREGERGRADARGEGPDAAGVEETGGETARGVVGIYRGGRAEFQFSRRAVQFLQRQQGAGGGGDQRRGQELRVAAEDSV